MSSDRPGAREVSSRNHNAMPAADVPLAQNLRGIMGDVTTVSHGLMGNIPLRLPPAAADRSLAALGRLAGGTGEYLRALPRAQCSRNLWFGRPIPSPPGCSFRDLEQLPPGIRFGCSGRACGPISRNAIGFGPRRYRHPPQRIRKHSLRITPVGQPVQLPRAHIGERHRHFAFAREAAPQTEKRRHSLRSAPRAAGESPPSPPHAIVHRAGDRILIATGPPQTHHRGAAARAAPEPRSAEPALPAFSAAADPAARR